MLNTKALCRRLKLADTKTVRTIANKYGWEFEARGGGKGFLWDVTDADIQQYFDDRAREKIPLSTRQRMLNDLIDLFDTAFSGRTFPNRASQIPIDKAPSYINYLEKKPPSDRVPKPGPGKNPLKTSSAMKNRIRELILDGFHSGNRMYAILASEGLITNEDGEPLAMRTVRGYVDEARKAMKIPKELPGVHVDNLIKKGYTLEEIVHRIGMNKNRVVRMMQPENI